MRISFNSWDLDFNPHVSEADMEARLKRCSPPSEVLDASGGYARLFYSLEFRPQFVNPVSSGASFRIRSSQTGIEPQLLPNVDDNLLYVGIAASVFVLEVPAGLKRRHDLESPFYWMTQFRDSNGILVVHETGLLWMHTDGVIAWHHGTNDVISAVHLPSPQTLEVKLLEGGSISIDLTRGVAVPM